MSEKIEMEPTTHSYLRGYWKALSDFGIWKNGKQYIGCMETEINEVMENKLKEMKIEKEKCLDFK